MASGDKEPTPMLCNVEFLDDDLDDLDDIGGEDVVHISSQDVSFDTAIGHIEDIIVDDEFQELQDSFLEENFEEFEDSDENKFSYTDIHKKYIDILEKFLDAELVKRMPGFSMEEFSQQLIERREELEGEVFDMLFTFTDFLVFKEMMVDYKKARAGNIDDLSLGITIVPLTPREGSSHGNGDVAMCSVGSSMDQSYSASSPGQQPDGSGHLDFNIFGTNNLLSKKP